MCDGALENIVAGAFNALLDTPNGGLSAKYQHQTHSKGRISTPFFVDLFAALAQQWNEEEGLGTNFENLALSVVDMRGAQ